MFPTVQRSLIIWGKISLVKTSITLYLTLVPDNVTTDTKANAFKHINHISPKNIIPKEELGDAANTLDNLTLRCRRCNVIKRPSHKHGGETFLTSEAALMWILFTKRPATYQEFEHLCRTYGLTMANVRFEEAWAMAKWLQREGKYYISEDSKY